MYYDLHLDRGHEKKSKHFGNQNKGDPKENFGGTISFTDWKKEVSVKGKHV